MSRRTRRSSNSSLSPDVLQNWELLSEAFEQEWQSLYGTIRVYVIQLGLSENRSVVDSIAEEILNDVVETAFKTVNKYDPSYPPRPWLRKIAFYKVKERKRTQIKNSVVIPIAEVSKVKGAQSMSADPLSEDEMFGLLYESSNPPLPFGYPALDDLLSLVHGRDREILRFAFSDGLKGKSLAAALGITEGAAYTGLSRALSKLREAYAQIEQASKREERDA